MHTGTRVVVQKRLTREQDALLLMETSLPFRVGSLLSAEGYSEYAYATYCDTSTSLGLAITMPGKSTINRLFGTPGVRVRTDGETTLRATTGRAQRNRPRTTARSGTWLLQSVAWWWWAISEDTRVLRSVVEMKYGTRVGPSHTLWPWVVTCSVEPKACWNSTVRPHLARASFLCRSTEKKPRCLVNVYSSRSLSQWYKTHSSEAHSAELHWLVGVRLSL